MIEFMQNTMLPFFIIFLMICGITLLGFLGFYIIKDLIKNGI